MDLPPGCRMTVDDKPAPADRGRLERELGRHNRPFLQNPARQRLGVFIRDDDNDLAAGLSGHTYGDWLLVENLWVREEMRSKGLGRELLAAAEQRARERGCHKRFFLQKRLLPEA